MRRVILNEVKDLLLFLGAAKHLLFLNKGSANGLANHSTLIYIAFEVGDSFAKGRELNDQNTSANRA